LVPVEEEQLLAREEHVGELRRARARAGFARLEAIALLLEVGLAVAPLLVLLVDVGILPAPGLVSELRARGRDVVALVGEVLLGLHGQHPEDAAAAAEAVAGLAAGRELHVLVEEVRAPE